MGVRGLTTFIAQNSSKYLKRYELHDTYLVIDGNNLASQLYKWYAKCYDCFGGDYDKYADTVRTFFNILDECGIIPLIIFDGGYEDKKLKTVYSRVKNKIKQTKSLNCITEGSMTVFPLFLRELFVEITLELGLKVVRCLVEADYEMACIARKLHCPLLSYDSDFYIFDVEYIPFNTVILNTVKSSKDNYKYLDCQIYRVDNFLKAYGGIKKDCVPLLGVLLGNDYVPINIFRNFYRHLKKSKKVGSDQQRRIKSLIAWLQNETFESAFRKVLGRIKQVHRSRVSRQILAAANNYVCSESDLLKYLKIDHLFANETSPTVNINMDEICDIETDNSDSGDESDNEEENSSESDIDELIETSIEEPNESHYSILTEYFEERYKQCLYPASFIDIILHHRHIFIPLIENFVEPPAHNISLPILSDICQILSSDNGAIKYILRNENGRMQSFKLPKSSKSLPTLVDLKDLTHSQSLKYMSDALDIDNQFLDMLDEFPGSWRLYIISLAYWIRNSNSKVNECFIYALLFSAIILNTVDKQIHRSENKFLKKFQKKIMGMKSQPVLANGNADMTPKEILDTISYSDGIMIMKEIVSNFDMIIKLRKNPKLFDSNIIYIFAQFQSSAFYIKYLNSLLNYPFEDYLISDFYNGTLIYNLSNNFLSRPQLDSYLQLLMKDSPNIYNSFMVIKKCLLSDITNLYTKNIVNKRKKKKKKKNTEIEIENESSVSDDNEHESVYDVNNRFSILKIIDR